MWRDGIAHSKLLGFGVENWYLIIECSFSWLFLSSYFFPNALVNNCTLSKNAILKWPVFKSDFINPCYGAFFWRGFKWDQKNPSVDSSLIGSTFLRISFSLCRAHLKSPHEVCSAHGFRHLRASSRGLSQTNKSVSARCRMSSCCVCIQCEAFRLFHPSRKTHVAGGVQVPLTISARYCGLSFAALLISWKKQQRYIPLPWSHHWLFYCSLSFVVAILWVYLTVSKCNSHNFGNQLNNLLVILFTFDFGKCRRKSFGSIEANLALQHQWIVQDWIDSTQLHTWMYAWQSLFIAHCI